MKWILNSIYVLLLAAASPVIAWQALRHGKYRAGWGARLWGCVPQVSGQRPVIWVHAVSVGEVKLASKIVPALSARLPGYQFVISSTSRTGYALAQREFSDHLVTYAPLDFSWAVGRAMKRLNPVALVLVELELWPNLIAAARKRGARVFIVNGRLSSRSYQGYWRLRFVLRRMLGQITWIGAQNREYQHRFLSLGAAVCDVTGSIKFDHLDMDRHNTKTNQLAQLVGLDSSHLVFLAGSTQPVEDEIAVRVFRRLTMQFPHLRLILVPRHPESFAAAARLAAGTGLPWVQRSEIREPLGGGWSILVVDSVGELASWWGRSDIAFVGGSLCNRGGQNMIEPAAFGAAVCFGPQTFNFRDISEALLISNAAAVVANESELESFLRRCCEEPDYRAQLGRAAAEFVSTQSGALDRTCDSIERLIAGGSRGQRAA